MIGVGPIEPGEETRAWDALEPGAELLPEPPRGRLARLYARHRRAVLASASAAVPVTGRGYLYAFRPQGAPPPPPPYPSNVVDVAYPGREATPRDAAPRSFSFGLELTARSGPPITAARMTAGLSPTSAPLLPFRTRTGIPHKIIVTLYMTDCSHAPNAGLPFTDVTLRNRRAIQVHSFTLGKRYAHDLSQAIQDACGNNFAS